MEDSRQKEYDRILSKIIKDYESVNVMEFRDLVEIIQSRYYGHDPIMNKLENRTLLWNMDLIMRAFTELIRDKLKWGSESRHYILSTLGSAYYGFSSESRKQIFINNNMISSDVAEFNSRYGFVKFKFFSFDEQLYLFIIHDYGPSSITNHIEEIVKNIESEFLEDLGFDIISDAVKIFYKDVGESYYNVKLDTSLKNPSWVSLEDRDDIDWFNKLWDTISEEKLNSSLEDELKIIRKPILIEDGKPYEAYKTIRDIISETKQHLFIVDPYVDPGLFDLLKIIKPTVNIRVLTTKTQMDSYSLAQKYKQERGNFDLRKTKEIHDRFIIVDDYFYLVGASINNLGSKLTSIIPITDNDFKATLKAHLEKKWVTED